MSDPATILVVEDDRPFSSFLQKLLRRHRYRSVSAGSGKAAIGLVKNGVFDLVLLDLFLTDMDGFKVLSHVRTHCPEIPAIIMTGNGSIDSAVRALKKGAHDYLTKPFAPEKLLNTLSHALEKAAMNRRHHQAVQKLEESKNNYQQLFENVSDGLIVFDAETLKIEEVNQETSSLLGYSKAALLGRRLDDLSAEKQNTRRAIRQFKKSRRNKEEIDLRRFRRKDGSLLPVNIKAGKTMSGNRLKIIAALRDISLRVQAEEKLRESEERFRNLVENSLIGIAIIQDDRFVYQNPVQEQLYGPLSGRPVRKLAKHIHRDDVSRVMESYEQVASGNQRTAEADFRFFPPGTQPARLTMRWVQCRANRFTYHGRNAILINSIDNTSAKFLEHQLIIKNKMHSLGRVAAGIAHEVRNPLTGINSYLFTLSDLCRKEAIEGQDAQLMHQIVEQIQVAANKIESVIKRVMDFSKPGAPKMILADINQVLEEAIRLSAVTLRHNGIKIHKSMSRNVPPTHIDPHLIEQVIVNLITNAARAMEKTGGDKRIELRTSARKNTLFVRVKDSGPGIPERLRDQIFDPFFTTHENGQGIGLNIAQRIVADHNGSISVKSGKSGGAEFVIEFPIEKRLTPR